MTVHFACWKLLCTAEGHYFQNFARVSPFSEKAVIEFIFPQLFVPIKVMAFTLTLYQFRMDATEMRDILLILASRNFMNLAELPAHRYLVVDDPMKLKGGQQVKLKYLELLARDPRLKPRDDFYRRHHIDPGLLGAGREAHVDYRYLVCTAAGLKGLAEAINKQLGDRFSYSAKAVPLVSPHPRCRHASRGH
jgi:hypothetical protein